MLKTSSIIIVAFAIILSTLGLRKKNPQYTRISAGVLHGKVEILFVLIILFFWLFALGVKDSYDLSNYRFAYNARIPHGKEPLYDSVKSFFFDAGWSFDQFKSLWVTIVSFLLYRGIKGMGSQSSAVAALALLTVLTGFVTQMRSSMVGVIFINSFNLLTTGKNRDRIAYIIITLISAQIHSIGYVFLVFIFVKTREKREFTKVYYYIIGFLTLVS